MRLEAALWDCARQLSMNLVSICASGLLDVVAQLRLNHVLAERPALETITVLQKDVRELQLANLPNFTLEYAKATDPV